MNISGPSPAYDGIVSLATAATISYPSHST